MIKYALFASLFSFALVAPTLAEDIYSPGLNWKDISADLKDLHQDFKDLHAAQTQLSDGLKAGTLSDTQVKTLLTEMHNDRADIRHDIIDLKNDGVIIHRPKH